MTPREHIIHFFETYCDNKLNKNHYRRKFYEDRQQGEIFDLIQNYFDEKSPLKTAPLAQKYYHIYHNLNIIPKEKFVNFVVGYRKPPTHKKKSPFRQIGYFEENVNKLCLLANKPIHSVEACVGVVGGLMKRKKYRLALECFDYIRSILFYCDGVINLQNMSVFEKICFFVACKGCLNEIKCECGNLVSFKKCKLQINKTCGSDHCVVRSAKKCNAFRPPENNLKKKNKKGGFLY